MIVATGNITGGNLITSGWANITGDANVTANIFGNNITAGNTISANTANSKFLNVDSSSLTASSPLSFKQEWNNSSVIFTGLKQNITDTSSNSNSLLIDLQVGSVSKASVTKAGNLRVQNASLGNSVTANYITIGQTTSSIIASTPATFVQEWNNPLVSFTGIQQNITDTASSAGSKLLDLQVGSVSKASITKAGNLSVQNANLGNLATANFVNVTYSTELTSSTPSQFNQTWNNSTISFTALQQNITDTGSLAGSKLLDLQVGGSSKFSVTKEGNTTAVNSLLGNLATANYITVAGSGLLTASTPSQFNQTWNNASATFDAIIANITSSTTTSDANSTLIHLKHTDTTSISTTYSRFKVDRTGNAIANAFIATTGSITASRPALDLTQTWNNSSVTFTGISLNVTDTLSNSNSKLIDLKVGGTTQFSVNKSGGAVFSGTVVFGSTTDVVTALSSGTTGVVEHNCLTSGVFYHPSPAGNISVRLTNVPTDINRIMVVSVLLQNGATPYIVNALTIREAGSSTDVTYSIKWLNGVLPVGNANGLDVYGLTLLKISSSTWVVTGSQATYG